MKKIRRAESSLKFRAQTCQEAAGLASESLQTYSASVRDGLAAAARIHLAQPLTVTILAAGCQAVRHVEGRWRRPFGTQVDGRGAAGHLVRGEWAAILRRRPGLYIWASAALAFARTSLG